MPRAKRIDGPGARHHVMNRGARRAPVFLAEEHCEEFLDLLAQLPERFGLAVHGFALMPNHYHLMLASSRGELSRGMAFLQSRYARLLNRERGWDGPLFRGRFNSRLVVRPEHWRYLLAYLHLNPVRARLVMRPNQAHWTSHHAYAGKTRPFDWLTTRELLAAMGGREGYRSYLRRCMRKSGKAPENFEHEVLFAGGHVGEAGAQVDEPKRAARSERPSLDQSLAGASKRLSAKPSELREARTGRAADPRRPALIWWLVQREGFRSKEVADAFGISQARVSQLVGATQRRAAGSALDDAAKLLSRAPAKS